MFESYFSDRLTFSNISGRTSGRIYRLALPLRAPETLSPSSKSRVFLYNARGEAVLFLPACFFFQRAISSSVLFPPACYFVQRAI